VSFQSKGGIARAKSLSQAERSKIASDAANARWSGTAKQAFELKCASGKSPTCAKKITVVAASQDQANRTIIRLNWLILHDHEKLYGYMCHECVKAHGECIQ
jgi:hypothetical protein